MSKILKLTAVVLAALAISACGSSANEYTPEVIPAGLKDCKFYAVQNRGSYMKIVRCPNSSVSVEHKNGKTSVYSSVIEDAI